MTMRPIRELTIGHIGHTIHVKTDDIDVTGELAGIRFEHDYESDYARRTTIGDVHSSTLTLIPDHEINLDGYRAEFEVVDQ